MDAKLAVLSLVGFLLDRIEVPNDLDEFELYEFYVKELGIVLDPLYQGKYNYSLQAYASAAGLGESDNEGA